MLGTLMDTGIDTPWLLADRFAIGVEIPGTLNTPPHSLRWLGIEKGPDPP